MRILRERWKKPLLMKLNFVETIRQPASLPSPVSYGFDKHIWDQAYLAQRDGSHADHHVYLLGHVLAHQITRVQGSVDQLASGLHFRSIEQLTGFFSARINEVQLKVFASFEKALDGVDVISAERVREMRCFIDAAGNSHALQVPMEAIVDASGNALKLLGRTGGLGNLTAEQPERIGIEHSLNHLMDLAQHSLSIQRVWNSVVWWGARVVVAPDCGSYRVDEKGNDLALRATIDLARRPALLTRAMENFKSDGTGASDDNILVPHVRLCDGRLTVQAVPARVLPDDQRKRLLDARQSQGILQDAALGSFVRESHPQVGLTVAEIMVIWGELAAIAGQICAMAQLMDPVKDKSKMAVLVESRLPRMEIIEAIKQCVVLSSDRAKECIDFLSFTPSKSATLWDKPLLAAGDDVLLLWWPLQGVHHARVLSAWARTHRKLKIAFDTKGPANEEILEQALRSAIETSPHGERMRFIGSGLHPRHKADEEIDLLILVDDTAFVIETASIPSPAEAYEFYEMEKRLDDKAGQCRAQCAALKHDLDQIAEWAEDDSLKGSVRRVFGLVVTNSYLRDGLYKGDICFCHWDTLINVIWGGMHFGLTRGLEPFVLKAPIQASSQGSVIDSFIASLQKSPKAEFFERCVVPVEYRVKGFDETDVEGYYRALEIDIPPQELLETKLRECSFGATLEEVLDPKFD